MAVKLDDIIKTSVSTEIDGHWYCAKPCVKPFVWRLKDAWGVLTGRYESHSFESEERQRKGKKT